MFVGASPLEDMNFFADAFGFEEHDGGRSRLDSHSFQRVRERFVYDAATTSLYCKANKNTFVVGRFDTPSLSELRASVASLAAVEDIGGLAFEHIVGNAKVGCIVFWCGKTAKCRATSRMACIASCSTPDLALPRNRCCTSTRRTVALRTSTPAPEARPCSKSRRSSIVWR